MTPPVKTPRVAFGPPRPARFGKVLDWYDGPVSYLVEGLDCGPGEYLTLAMVNPDEPDWTDTAIAITLGGLCLSFAQSGKVDLRMLMTRPEALLWRVDYAPKDTLLLSRILSPLPDWMLPEHALLLSDFLTADEGA